MKVYKNDFDKITEPVVASIGFFDGVHQGHRSLIEQIIAEAKRTSMASAVVTFINHPRLVLDTDFKPALLCGYDEKLKNLAATGLDYCMPLDFTAEMSQMSACEFMKFILKEKLHVDTLIVGYDHRFGHNRSDGFAQYVECGRKIGMTVIQAKELDTGEYVSSSRIRKLIQEGTVEEAAKLLTHNYTISGKIVEGYKVGRTIGFPTANIQIWERFKVIPAHGVYAVHVYIANQKYNGMLYVGKRPTLHSDSEVSIEVNIFDFNGDLYGVDLTVEFIQFTRRDVRFSSLQILKRQLEADKEKIKKLLGTKQ